MSYSHSRIGHYFFSYLLTREVDLFEVLVIMAQMWPFINFFSYKPIKVTLDFILNCLKKVVGGATTQEKLKTNAKTLISSIWICPQRPQGWQRKPQDPLNMPFKVWCANIALKLKNIQKTLRKQGFLTCFFQFWRFFEVCTNWTKY